MNGGASRYKTERAARRRKRIVYVEARRCSEWKQSSRELERWHRLGHRLLYYRGVRWLRYESISGVKRDSVMGVQWREASKVTAIIFFARSKNTEISFPFLSFFLLFCKRRMEAEILRIIFRIYCVASESFPRMFSCQE